MLSDVAVAFLEASARTLICVELPVEAKQEPHYVGKSRMSFHSTLGAAAPFQNDVEVHGGAQKARAT